MSKKYDIEVNGLSKSFKLPTEKSNNLKQTFVNWTRGIKGYKEQAVLKDISFKVEKGDFFGIVGRNGSGKSTLLKLLAGIYEPDCGSIKVNGTIVPFIELGVGFNPELTGYENVYLNGALLGFSTKEIDAMYDDIVDFAELHEFMGQKLKNYSSGMQVRLAFSIAIKAQGDILILDEVLAVGDEAFQRKCYKYFASLKRNKQTVILVTHSMDTVQQFCNKAIMIQEGKIAHSGNTTKVAQAYRELNNKDVKTAFSNNMQEAKNNIDVKVKYNNLGDKLGFDFTINSKVDVVDPVITFLINRDNGEMVYRWVTDEKISGAIDIKAGSSLKFYLEIENIFPNGVFDAQLGIKKRDRSVEYAMFNQIVKFEIVNKSSYAKDILWKPKEKTIFQKGIK